jgi:serine/threonine protein kinase
MYYNMSINGYNEHYNNLKLNNIYTELYNLDNDLTINGILTVDNVNVKNKLVSDYITVYNGLMSDLWSCGVVLYAMLCGYLPYEDQKTSDLYKKILNAEYTLPDFLSPEA